MNRPLKLMGVVTTGVLLLSLLFLGQASSATRAEKREQIDSQLKNAATAEESYLVSNDSYTRVLNELKEEGFRESDKVQVIIARINSDISYCIEGQHDGLGEIWNYSSRRGTVVRGRC